MTTIATDILRDYEQEVANLPKAKGAETSDMATTPYLLMLRLCEQAHGTRIGYHEWVFPDGSQLLM
ncbi:MAG: hypothetical protein GVY13_16435 [Alphaproteobacteria bacterium]|jgi:hypothetical protein|nr:hypothetical protein [Alphaproteobacteria bacterium]